MIVELDCRMMPDRGASHDYLAEKFEFPGYYGRNLDALFDLLSTYEKDAQIIVRAPELLEENLGTYGKNILKTLEDAARENPKLTLQINLKKMKIILDFLKTLWYHT